MRIRELCAGPSWKTPPPYITETPINWGDFRQGMIPIHFPDFYRLALFGVAVLASGFHFGPVAVLFTGTSALPFAACGITHP